MATQLSSPSFAQQNTTGTNDLGPDGYSWAAARPLTIDKFGKIIAIISRQNAGTVAMLFTVSNDNGATWTDPARTGFAAAAGEIAITRGCLAYDSVNDLCHVLWNGTAATDGMIYRRYSISRDGSNNITGFTKDAAINLQLDFQTTGTMEYQHPNLIWMTEPSGNGQLLAVWGVRNSAAAGNKVELRASMRVLSNSAADNTAGNWLAPVTSDTTGIGNAPAVAYSIIDTGNYASVAYPGVHRLASGTRAKDVVVGYYDGNAAVSGGSWKMRRMRWSAGSNNWSTGLGSVVTLSTLVVAGADTGYSLKSQLVSQIVEDTVNDRVAIGYAVWLSNASGDTWSFTIIDNTDTAGTRVDVYSAGGAHAYAPVGDLIFDATWRRFVVAYQKQDTFAYLKTYNGTTVDQAETAIYTGSRVDIPLLCRTRINTTKLLIAFRDSVNTPTPPYHGYAGTLTWANATAMTGTDVTSKLAVHINGLRSSGTDATSAFQQEIPTIRSTVTNANDLPTKVRDYLS